MLKTLLPRAPDPAALAALGDDRVLAGMARRIFSAGFAWSVIENKWPGFEAAFLSFDPGRLLFEPDEFWERLCGDTRIVRNPQKIMSVRANARFVSDISREHGGFGRFLAAWPAGDQVGLMKLLADRGSRLGGATGQYFLRFVGFDSFMTSPDVVACLRDAGLDVAETPTSRRDLTRIQDQFNAWRAETGLSVTQMSRICAMSIGPSYDLDTLRQRAGVEG
ncbi:MAG: DNA-3-methyladenine glycosylase I [Caulobacteraceae bacterium]|nr:DNA-3-methyladenine glycosylase I [Caulobacteraceae bacterium]